MANLRESYIYMMALVSLLYGEKYFSRFSEALMPLSYTIAISERGFKWGAIIFQTPEHFHTTGSDTKRRRDSILLHGFLFIRRHLRQKYFCRNELELACLGTPVHVYFSILWGIGTKIPTPLSSMNSSLTFIPLFSIKSVQDYRLRPKR
jgi:hypothetical protein